MKVSTERLAQIKILGGRSHQDISRGMCVMEAVSYVTREPWSDRPQCVCPVITEFMISWNDALPDDDRNRLLIPLIPLIVGTRSTRQVEERRAYMALDWLVRVSTPQWLDLAPSLRSHAAELRALDAITNTDAATAAGDTVKVVWTDAWDVAWRTALDPVQPTAWAAVRSAALNAAWMAASYVARSDAWGAAVDVARAAAWAAAGESALDAARSVAGPVTGAAALDAAKNALEPTTKRIQGSASELVLAMVSTSTGYN